MATHSHQKDTFRLPARPRIAANTSSSLPTGLALADRIADLPGIVTAESNSDTVPREVRVYLQTPAHGRSIRSRYGALLCTISSSGVVIHGLDPSQRHRVLSRGWGTLVSDAVQLFLPRNDAELEICWSLLRSAYDRLYDPSATQQGAVRVSIWDLPSFSRTTLQ